MQYGQSAQPNYGMSYPAGYQNSYPPQSGPPGYYPAQPGYGNPNPGYQQYPPQNGYAPTGYPAQPAPYPTGQAYPLMQSGYNAPPPPPPQDMPNVMMMQPQVEIKQQELFIITHEKTNSKYPTTANGVPHPAQIHCTVCNRNITTVVTDKAGSGTWTWCVILACFVPACCCVPFCISSCQDKVHTCPSCQNQVGLYEYKVF